MWRRVRDPSALPPTSDIKSGSWPARPPALAAIEQCRFIQAKPEREACYQRQAAALAAKRKPEPTPDTTTLESLQQMRRDDDAMYKSLRGICRGC
jgi:hypothetical protein